MSSAFKKKGNHTKKKISQRPAPILVMRKGQEERIREKRKGKRNVFQVVEKRR